MPYKVIKYLLLLSLTGVIGSKAYYSPEQTAEWKLAKDKNNIKVYTRERAGADVKEFKAITFTTAKMEQMESHMTNVEEYPAWKANVTTSKILKQVSPTEMYIYYTSDLPWPVSDRDVISQCVRTETEEGVVTYTFYCKPDYIPRNEDYIRIPSSLGSWQFIPESEGRIKVIYQFFGDPGGSLPAWVINLYIVDGPYETLVNLKERTED